MLFIRTIVSKKVFFRYTKINFYERVTLLNSQRWLSFGFFFFFITWGIFLPFWTGWLTTDKGLTVTAASIVMGVGMILRSFSTFLFFPMMTRKAPLVLVIRWMGIASIVALILYIPASSFTALLIITALFSMFYPTLLPAIESSATVLMQREHIHYGKSRSYGSIGYTVSVFIIGALIGLWGEGVILYGMIAGLGILVFYFFQRAPVAITSFDKSQEHKKTSLIQLFQSKTFIVIAILAILLQGAHTAYYNYGFIYLNDLQVNGVYIGLILNIAVLFEIIFFTQADRYFANVKISTLYIIASAGSSLRWLLIFIFPTASVFILSQGLHALSFGFAHYAFIQYISKHLDESLIAPAQGFYAAFAMSLSIAILTFPAGFLYDLQPSYAFASMMICSVPALLLVLTTRKKLQF